MSGIANNVSETIVSNAKATATQCHGVKRSTYGTFNGTIPKGGLITYPANGPFKRRTLFGR